MPYLLIATLSRLLLLFSLCLSLFTLAQESTSLETTTAASTEDVQQEKHEALESGPPTKDIHESLKTTTTKTQQSIIDTAINDFKVTNEDGEEVICSKEDTVAVDIDGKVNYRCRTTEKALGETSDVQQGEGETNQLIDSLLIESKQADDTEIKLNTEQIKAITEATEKKKEKDALELPPSKEETEQEETAKAKQDAKGEAPVVFEQKEDGELQVKTQKTSEDDGDSKQSKTSEETPDTPSKIVLIAEKAETSTPKPFQWIQKIPIKAYLSLRASYKSLDQDTKLQDDNTRFGFIYAKKLNNEDRLILHFEAGTNMVDQVVGHVHEGEDTSSQLNSRLAYFRYGREDYYTVIGKNWSVYHYIASMTDKFNSVGGKATGIYNAGSDGGGTGTGRASKALQLRSSRGIFQWGAQLQSNTDMATFDDRYSLNAAIMGKIKFLNGLGLGTSILKAVPADITPEMISNGFTGETTAGVIGAEWKIADWDFSVTTAGNKNLVTDDQLYYYDAWGAEFYTTTKFTPLTQFRLGLAYQTPSNTQQYTAQHEIIQAYIGWQYNYSKNNFADRIFVEYAFNAGSNADGSDADDILNFGIRYNFQN